MEEPLNLTGSKKALGVNVAKHVLSEGELAELGDKVESDLPFLEEEHAEGDYCVTQNSIILARKERRSFVSTKRRAKQVKEAEEEEPGYSKPKKCQAIAIEQEEGQLQLGNYYSLVHVCLPCYRVYRTLDKARHILQSKHVSSRMPSESSTTTESRSVLSSRDYLAKHGKLKEKRRDKEKGEEASGSDGLAHREVDKEVYYKLPSIYRVKPTRAMAQELKQSSEIKDFQDLDGYLRGVRESKKPGLRRLKKSPLGSQRISPAKSTVASDTAPRVPHDKRGRVLLVESDPEEREAVKLVLESKDYLVTALPNGEKALETLKCASFDLMLIDRVLEHLSGIEVVKILRKQERSSSHRMSIVALSHDTEPEDLRLFMEAGMDGCVSKPVDEEPLLETVAAAIPHHQPLSSPSLRRNNAPATSSSTIALRTLPPARSREGAGVTSRGTYRLSSDISLPYVVLGERVKGSRVFNFVVVHDIFDTLESMELFFRPLVKRYVGMQVLLFNYSGQAFTEWREDTILNNTYHAECLEKLLHHVDGSGTGEFHNRGPYASPYYVLGFGNGANIALCHALAYKPLLLRSCLLLNGFTHVDPNLAAILHDCVSVFSCSPSTRPDLPVYFYTRFIFSPKYLTKVSTPLALNMYTAVHNPITLEGRIQLCKGALAHVDLREELRRPERSFALLLGQSAQGMLVKPYHVDTFLKIMGGEAGTIRESLTTRKRPCVVWFQAGHELFQECRRSLSDLIEQLASGYHEKYSAKFIPSVDTGKSRGRTKTTSRNQAGASPVDLRANAGSFEDRFINNVLKSLNNEGQQEEEAETEEVAREDNHQWKKYREEKIETTRREEQQKKLQKKQQRSISPPRACSPNIPKIQPKKLDLAAVALDPESRYFDARDKRLANRTKEKKLEVLQSAEDIPEVREYMQWRISRNKKRLRELEANSKVIQRAWRAFLARTMYDRMKRESSALRIETAWRAYLARCLLGHMRREVWASKLVQRNWRGKHGRDKFKQLKGETLAAQHVQRLFRGKLGKKRVKHMKKARYDGAKKIQMMIRAYFARTLCWKLRVERNAAVDIQRTWRGNRGRMRALGERDKYLFSKAQSQGIDFGRQMLLEHKLHGTRLQSEVSLLTKDKVETEEKVEALLNEIVEFDKGVRALEKEMHELTTVETEAKGMLDEEAKIELREQKMRLDKEFGVMLGKIADRKERLNNLEDKLQKLDRTRQSKEEELKDLERKLVVLLEDQQVELEQIKMRQAKNGTLQAQDSTVGDAQPQGHGSGPTPQQQQQANTLMQSTESMMKFGFMSMSLTYFSSINMIKAMRKVGAVNTVLGATAAGTGSTPSLQSASHLAEGGGTAPSSMENKGEVSTWSVNDVGDWLETLTLGQYREAFFDAAIDGAFLYDLNDEDLRNTLGIEHSLHRKKILSSIARLRQIDQPSSTQLQASSTLSAVPVVPIQSLTNSASNSTSLGVDPSGLLSPTTANEGPGSLAGEGPVVTVPNADKLFRMVRHGKVKDLRKELQVLPDARFDPKDVREAFVQGFGTQYDDVLVRLQWHINKPDEHGNTLLGVACQNGNMKIAKLLVSKGANPNHQNVSACAHHAMIPFVVFTSLANSPPYRTRGRRRCTTP